MDMDTLISCVRVIFKCLRDLINYVFYVTIELDYKLVSVFTILLAVLPSHSSGTLPTFH